MKEIMLRIVYFLAFWLSTSVAYTDIPCQWRSKTGATFDLRPLQVLSEKGECYYIKDGDIPCTPEIEPTFSYVWNFCADVTENSFPAECNPAKMGSAIQYYSRADGYKECNIIGHYDASRDDTFYSLLDEKDPSKGISMRYLYGDQCPGGKLRSATIDVMCGNVKVEIDSAIEPNLCEYHMQMKSYHGCPLECPVTDNGLCNSHGHCYYDPVMRSAKCFCNEGYGGSACTPSSSSGSDEYNGLGVQIGLMVTLLVITLILVGIVGYLAYQITEFRKSQHSLMNSQHGMLSSSSHMEMSSFERY